MKAECTISKPYPRGIYCHKEGGYDPKHFQCIPCSFNSVAAYKKDMKWKAKKKENQN